MKSFNLFIIVSLILITGGFLFFKDGFSTAQSKISDQTELRMDMLNYLDYSESSLSAAQLKGTSILFFAATKWCQTCSELEKEIVKRHVEIPKNVTILKVDYDNDRFMNQKHQVTSQHTLIILDQNGQEMRRWIGGGFDTLLLEFEKI